jgi:excisionase family DNA binding protein
MTANISKTDMQVVADLITANTIFCTKEVLTSDEAAAYMGISKSYLYKLTMRQQIPFYKPMGKRCYFNRQELEQWLQSNRVSTDAEISQKAQNYCMKGGLK